MRIVMGRGKNRSAIELPAGSVWKAAGAESNQFIENLTNVMRERGIRFAS